MSLEGSGRKAVLGDVRRILDRVVAEYPTSPEAEIIRSGGSLVGLNVAALDAELAGQASVPQAMAPEGLMAGDAPAPAPGPVPLAPLDARERMRLVQAALNERGCKTGTPDGVPGRKTTRGYQAFLKKMNLNNASHPLESEAFWKVLMSARGEICEAPPVVPVSARHIPGKWSYTARCGKESKAPGLRVSGVLTLSHLGNNSFKGNLVNSQGLRARVTGRLSGRRVSLNAYFGFLLGNVKASGRVADDAYVVHGRDSNRCRFTARKR
ncbi:MAG: hypothetical protein OIF48_17790 [Silicimonas sp.]|nr:hypothetical protein [Silicimonas sp.]